MPGDLRMIAQEIFCEATERGNGVYVSPRWQKTKVTFFASCVKPEIEDKITKESTVVSNGSKTTSRRSSASEEYSKSEGTSPSSLDEAEDVFVAKYHHRRASEPLKRDTAAVIGRFGRRKLNALRTLSEGWAKEKLQAHRKLTRSTSSSESSSCDRSSAIFNFSPQVVKKITLRSSLQDWLESEKKLPDIGKWSRDTRLSDSGVAREQGKKSKRHLAVIGRSKSLNPELVLRREQRDINNNHMEHAAKHVYRRFSADSVGTSAQSQSCNRRTSAPSLFGDNDSDHKRNGQTTNAVNAETVTSSLNIREPANVACCNSDIKYDNMQDFHIQCVMKEELQSRLSGVTFCPETCRERCEEITENIKERVELLSPSPCKVVCTIYIGALRDSGIHCATQALLDNKLDNHATARYQNESLFAVASVFAVRYNCK